MSKVKWKTDKQLISNAVSNSRSVADVCRTLGITPAGQNFKTVKRWIEFHGIDIGHFDPITHRMIQHNISRRRTHEDIFKEGSEVTQKVLRTAAIRDNIMERKCTECGLEDMWNNKPITLQLDHINGVRNDNRKENLRWLCPNCHSQTHTYCGKNNKQ